MALELITGYRGERHIASEDIGAFNLGLIGGDYILPTGNRFSVSYDYRNLTINSGDLILQGRHIRLRDGDVYNYGVSGVSTPNSSRYDLICICYTINNEGVENAEFVVINGDEVINRTLTDEDVPEHITGQIAVGDTPVHFPLYRLEIDKNGIKKVKPLFKTYTAFNGLASDKTFAGSLAQNSDFGACLGSANSAFARNLAWNGYFASVFTSTITNYLGKDNYFGSVFASNTTFASHFANHLASDSTFAGDLAQNSTFGACLASQNIAFAENFAWNDWFASRFASRFISYFEYALSGVGCQLLIPKPSSGDAGKVLSVENNGDLKWVTP